MSDFPSNPRPDYPLEEVPAIPDVLISVHRDGSEQRRFKGAGRGPTFNLNFGGSCPITKTQRDAILAHFADVGLLEAFEWMHPERTAEEYLVCYAEAPSFTLVAYNAYQGNVKLKVVPA